MLSRGKIPRLQHPFRQYTRRFYATTDLGNGIKMAYDLYEPPKGAETQTSPIIFMHGFLGSKRNNRSMSKVFARELKRPVYAVDLRNHGDSSHNARHDYTAMAEDVELFLDQHRLRYPTLIGHSMGAKTAMTIALRQRTPIARLIPVDNSPVDAALRSDFTKYMQGLRKIAEAHVTKQAEADAILKDYEESSVIRQFLLMNLTRGEDGIQKFRVPLKYLTDALGDMGDFPFHNPDDIRWEGPTLFVRGTKSHYVADEFLPVIGRFFPKFELVDIESGHWVISEKPEEFRKAVVEWLSDRE